MRRRKKYTGDIHDQPYDFEDSVFDRVKEDQDRDARDLADKAFEYRPHNDTDDDERAPEGASAIDGRLGARNPNVAAVKARTGQLIQDGGGYAAQADPATAYTEATRFYCVTCGEPIKRHADRPCEHPDDPCVLLAPRGRLLTGCQACREWWSVEQGHHRSGRGRQSYTCKPTDEDRAAGRKKSKCARLWDSEKRRAKREGRAPVVAPPKLTRRDRTRVENAIFDAEQRRRGHPCPGNGTTSWYWEEGWRQRRRITNQFDPRVIPPERHPNGRHYGC